MITNMSNLNLIDAASTPVTHVFTPASRVAENTARWVDREHNAGVPIGFLTISMSVKEPTTPDGVFRVKVTFSEPKLDLTNPTVPRLLANARFTGEFIFPGVFSDQERKDVVKKVTHLLALNGAAQLGDNIFTLSLPY